MGRSPSGSVLAFVIIGDNVTPSVITTLMISSIWNYSKNLESTDWELSSRILVKSIPWSRVMRSDMWASGEERRS